MILSPSLSPTIVSISLSWRSFYDSPGTNFRSIRIRRIRIESWSKQSNYEKDVEVHWIIFWRLHLVHFPIRFPCLNSFIPSFDTSKFKFFLSRTFSLSHLFPRSFILLAIFSSFIMGKQTFFLLFYFLKNVLEYTHTRGTHILVPLNKQPFPI